MKKINPLIYIVAVAILFPILTVLLILIGVPGGVAGMVVLFVVIIGFTVLGTQLKKKK